MFPPYGGDPSTQGGSSTGPGIVPPRPGQPVFQRPPAAGATGPAVVQPKPGQPVFQKPPAPGALLTGTVKSYSAKGFGFILCPEVDSDVYFARESLQDGLRTANIAGTVVQFVLQRGLHGKPQATYLRPLEGQIAPTEYNRGYVESRPQPAPAAFVPPAAAAAAAPAFYGKGGFGQPGGFSQPCAPCGMPQIMPQTMPQYAQQTMPQYGQQYVFPGGQPGFAPPGQFSHMQPRPAGWPLGQQPGAALLNMALRPPAVTPQKRLSPHAGSRALAGRPPAGAGEAKKDDSSDRGSSEESSREESDSSSSDKKKKKKKKKKGSKKDKKEKKDRSRSRSARKKSKSRKSSGSRSRSRLSVSSSSRERSQPKEARPMHLSGHAASSSEGQKNIENAKREVLQQLENLKKIEPKETRMKEWRSLLRSWHPDKNPEKVEVATAVFQFLQKGKLLLDL
eukprot:TRINITY_DN13324_c0_g1_i2.p1 TRINITY_DN13324_c0_g1~~TRINITY_DN13324_c0_g1_i2.p1  ORF type:complete len:450 (-),score=69.66 TRINITY_DN13324_c0_g1_i2:63-1412(-)